MGGKPNVFKGERDNTEGAGNPLLEIVVHQGLSS
jgi:hypothetical protein